MDLAAFKPDDIWRRRFAFSPRPSPAKRVKDGLRQLHMFHMFNEAEALVEQEKEPEPITVPATPAESPNAVIAQ